MYSESLYFYERVRCVGLQRHAGDADQPTKPSSIRRGGSYGGQSGAKRLVATVDKRGS